MLEELRHATMIAGVVFLVGIMADNPSSRFIVALVGAPGSGKSTVARRLVDLVDRERSGLNPVVVPMDGFHLDNSVLDRLGLRARKGAPQTFDACGYINALSRIHQDREIAQDVHRLLITHKESMIDPNIIDTYNELEKEWDDGRGIRGGKKPKKYFSFNLMIDNVIETMDEIFYFPFPN